MRSAVVLWMVLSIPTFFAAAAAQDLSKAKQEGSIVFYTSWGPGDADYVVKGFERKYPPLKVETVRASSERTLTRLLNEHRAGTFLGDVVAVSGIQSGILKARGSLDRYQSPEAANFPAEWRDPEGYGTGLHQTIYVIGYNSRLVSSDAVPRSYEDLLQPRWKSQLGWDTEEYYLFGALLKVRGKEKGLDYWRRLAVQQINFRKGYTLISELVSAGEFPVAVSLYQHRVDEYAEKGAPLQWIAPNPLVGGDPNKISILKNAPRPNAAKLFIDFMLSAEGQKLLQDKGRSPGRIGPRAEKSSSERREDFHSACNRGRIRGPWQKSSTGFSKCNEIDMALKLSMTCGPYDRARALVDGTVKPEGIELDIRVNRSPGRHTKIDGKEFDAAEFYTATYIADLQYKTLGYTAVPIFVKRMFRHSYIYINKHSGIRSPADLNGRRIGVQNWLTTTAVWSRGLLEDEYGLDPKSVTWMADRISGVGDWKPPVWLKIETVPPEQKQFDLLASGAIDAAITTGTWAPNVHPDVDFLFPNYGELERDYFKRTGFFPIMHTLIIKNSVLEKDPWVAMSLFKAWQESKQKCYEWLQWQRVHQTGLWYRALWEEEQAIAGNDPYMWGFRSTRPEVDKLLEYCHRQGLTARKFEPEEMFHPSMLET